MVHMSCNGKKSSVKLEVDDFIEDQLGSLQKRPKLNSSSQMIAAAAASGYNPLDEPSPLGLNLKKSPSFLDLIQMKLSQERSSNPCNKDQALKGNSCNTDKLKATNFPASLLKIGTWEYKSRYEGDLVAKCYFAKHKLVWEVLDGGLKNKMEIQWSDIVAIKAFFPEDEGPETLDVVLARPPLFFRETNPQPRKHTLWQTTSDFTNGQASIHRQHFLQCQPSFLGKHFEKLIQCDPRLNFLSKQPDILLESPYFEQSTTASNNFTEPKVVNDLFALHTSSPPSGVLSSSLDDDHQGFTSVAHKNLSQEMSSAESVEETRKSITEDTKLPCIWNQMRGPALQPSVSMNDLMSYLEQCISDQKTPSNLASANSDHRNKDVLEEITQHLLSDTQLIPVSDQKSLMSRVNSLYCLLKEHGNAETETSQETNGGPVCQNGESENPSNGKRTPAMSRKDSLGDLLLNLPRIASLPQFLHNIQEDD